MPKEHSDCLETFFCLLLPLSLWSQINLIYVTFVVLVDMVFRA